LLAALICQELEHTGGGNSSRILRDDREEGLKVQWHRAQGDRPGGRNQLQIPVRQRITKPIPRLTGTGQPDALTREVGHRDRLPASDPATPVCRKDHPCIKRSVAGLNAGSLVTVDKAAASECGAVLSWPG
jgi:hypothetical protein